MPPMLVVDTPGKLVSSASYNKQQVCNRSHARQVNSGKIKIFTGVPLSDVLVQGESPHAVAQNLVRKTRHSTLTSARQ